MSELVAATQKATPAVAALGGEGLLQRKCVCGNNTMAGGECVECGRQKLRRSFGVGAAGDAVGLEGDRNADRALTSRRFGGDFAHVPVRSGAAVAPWVEGGQPIFKPASPIQRKAIFGAETEAAEREADRVADRVLAGRRAERQCAKPVANAGSADGWPVAEDRLQHVEAALSGGAPLPSAVRARIEPALGMDLGQVRIHDGPQAARAAEALRARAFASGPHVVFGAGQYAPGRQEGLHLLAHELAHVAQQGAIAAPRIDRSNAVDHRLPADQPEALAYAAAAQTAIAAALTALGGAADRRSKNVPALVTQEALTIKPLTPRHDSTVATGLAPNPPINFFTGSSNYLDSVLLPADRTHRINAGRTQIAIRARGHANVDNLLPAVDIQRRIVAAVSEVAHTRAAQQAVGALTVFDLYRARFNALYREAPFSAMSEKYDANLSSRGPKTGRSRSVFQKVYTENNVFAAAYDTNAGDIREKVDRYQGPEGLNLPDSPGLQRLRAATFAFAAPLPAANYPAFKAAITAAAQTLAAEDRAEVDRSSDWQLLIDSYVATAAQRDEIKNIIRTATPPAAAPPPPVVAPPAAPGGGAVTPQAFVDAVTLQGPAAPVPSVDRHVPVPLKPASGAVNNPGVAISTQITVTPAASVIGANVSPATVWGAGANAGAVFAPNIAVTGSIGLDAQLALVNGPVGLARKAPIPPLHFSIDDRRQTNMGAHWQPSLKFSDGSRQVAFVGASKPRYIGGGQTIDVTGVMPVAPGLNPGLTLSVRSRIERGGVVIAGPSTKPYPPGVAESSVNAFAITAPAAVPVGGDPISIIAQLQDASGVAVGAVRNTPMTVGAEATYTKAQAQTRWTEDEAYLHSAAGFLASLTAAGGAAAGLAGLVKTAANPAGEVIIHPMIQRHDSAAYVKLENLGTPDPTRSAYLITAPPYGAHPDPNHTIVLGTGAGGWRIPGHPAYPGTFILLSRTPDVTLGVPRRLDAELQIYAIHEATHFMDRGHAAAPIEQYKTEFRAYWMDGRFGPPNVAIGGFNAVFDPTIPPPGPKSPRANRIFHETYDNPRLYPYSQPNYDANTNHFREEVDSYLVPDGINLILSAQLEALRVIFAAGIGASFATFRTSASAFFGVGPAPAGGALSAAEKKFVTQSRAWRDRVDGLAGTNPLQKALLKTDMGIP